VSAYNKTQEKTSYPSDLSLKKLKRGGYLKEIREQIEGNLFFSSSVTQRRYYIFFNIITTQGLSI
jgi:hypothetical protein